MRKSATISMKQRSIEAGRFAWFSSSLSSPPGLRQSYSPPFLLQPVCTRLFSLLPAFISIHRIFILLVPLIVPLSGSSIYFIHTPFTPSRLRSLSTQSLIKSISRKACILNLPHSPRSMNMVVRITTLLFFLLLPTEQVRYLFFPFKGKWISSSQQQNPARRLSFRHQPQLPPHRTGNGYNPPTVALISKEEVKHHGFSSHDPPTPPRSVFF
jgi:hypothetical protein